MKEKWSGGRTPRQQGRLYRSFSPSFAFKASGFAQERSQKLRLPEGVSGNPFACTGRLERRFHARLLDLGIEVVGYLRHVKGEEKRGTTSCRAFEALGCCVEVSLNLGFGVYLRGWRGTDLSSFDAGRFPDGRAGRISGMTSSPTAANSWSSLYRAWRRWKLWLRSGRGSRWRHGH
jgi:hypothetical protein